MTNPPYGQPSVAGPQTETALTVTQPKTSTFLDQPHVIDDTPLWIAWESAETAWLQSKQRRSGGQNTVRAYKLAVRQFFAFALVSPWQVSPGHAQEWAVHLSTVANNGEPLAPATVSLKLAALSSYYDYVQRRYTFQTPDGRHISLWPADRANPFLTVERPKVSPYGRSKYPTTDELQAILAAINTKCRTGKRDFALLYTIATTCRRASETLNMQWGHIRELGDGNYAFTYRYKGGDTRDAVLHRRAYQAILAYLHADDRPPEHMEDHHYIFIPLYPDRHLRMVPNVGAGPRACPPTDPNRPLSNHQANSILKKYARRLNIDPAKAHIHALRHAGARLRVEQMKDRRGGVDYMELMQLLGHSSLAVTQIYSQTVLEDPEDPGGDAAADALLPKGPRRPPRPQPKQERLIP